MPISSRNRVCFLPLAAILLAVLPFLLFSASVDGQPPPETTGSTLVSETPPADTVAGQPPAVEGLTAADTPDDEGGSVTVKWTEPAGAAELGLTYRVMRADSPDGQYTEVCELAAGENEFMDAGLTDGQQYCYKVFSIVGPGTAESGPTAPASPRGNWFRMYRLNALILLLVFSGSVLYYISRARRAKPIYIRKIAGLNAVDEAVGRATEMGKKILYIPGIMSIDEIQTIASLAILGHVARLSAQYNADLEVPNKDPLTFASARETVKEAYLEAGRPDLFREEMVNYVTYDQFAYTASVTGKMVRERPATNFLIGSFYAESLLLAESGQSVGAIQISGTAEVAQLPFFVVACDYTLIGEELYAASAYLSREPVLLGSIKGQDLTKLLLMLALGLGVILESFGVAFVKDAFRMH
ncbi:MAG: fibronectin type III domain-containing protein [Candidatus Eisenbacteria bacterium]|nr:fibronectin type III domain-containing protein [Candidatus Eisenbacteria bacterium]